MYDLIKWRKKWWPGLVPLAVLWALALWNTTVPLEAELTERANSALNNTILDRTRVTLAGRDVRFEALAFSEEGRLSAISSVAAAPGVRLVDDHTRLVAEAKPYSWSASRDVVRVILSGHSPLPASKTRVLEAARSLMPGVEVQDQSTLARGAPPRFEATAAVLVEQLSRLKEGRVSISDGNVSLSGMARELGGREAIAAALRSLPDGFKVDVNDVKAPPYIFQVNKDPVSATLTLTGYVPDNAIHEMIKGTISRKFLGEKLVDSLKSSIGAPRGFSEAVTASLGALSRLSTGTLIVSDRQVTLSGHALYDVAAERIRTSLPKELPQGWTAKAELSTKPPSAAVDATVCQQLLTELLGKAAIRFDTGKASIDRDSAGLLDRLIEIAQRCNGTQIEIVGHTDSDGDAASNQALSERRASAVVDYLVNAGLPPDRFTANGLGSTAPIAPNDTEADKAKNRRIEFQVR